MSTTESLLKNRYEVHELIGQGGMASVYRGLDTSLGREVAIKIFAASADDIEGARQEHEVNLLASLTHRSLVTLLDAGVDRSDRDRPQVFLVMELVRGRDLQRALSDGPLGARHVSQLGFDLAEGLQYMHRHGVVHRDVKPSNVLLVDYDNENPRAHAVLTDFGIASRGIAPPDLDTTTGTAAYLSPEQVRREEVGSATDIYSLGLVLLECFTGELAFPGGAVDSAMSRLVSDPRIPRSIGPDWRSLISAMTANKPGDRPEASEVLLALRDLAMAESGRHRTSEPSFIPGNEAARIEAVRRYDLLDSPPDGAFDRITRLAARVLNTPVAIISIVDTDRIWFKSHHGLAIDQIDRDPGLCASAILNGEPWVVENARIDPRALANPLVASDFGLQFYAGVPLTSQDGFNLGTLCVLDFEPRVMHDDDLANLRDLAAMVMDELEIRLARRRLLAVSADLVT